jgi:hypothetical protein
MIDYNMSPNVLHPVFYRIGNHPVQDNAGKSVNRRQNITMHFIPYPNKFDVHFQDFKG